MMAYRQISKREVNINNISEVSKKEPIKPSHTLNGKGSKVYYYLRTIDNVYMYHPTLTKSFTDLRELFRKEKEHFEYFIEGPKYKNIPLED